MGRVPPRHDPGPGGERQFPPTRPPRRRALDALDLVDVFVYVVILNLAIEYLPDVISETFTLSLLTAVLLKATLEVVLLAKGHIMDRLRSATTRLSRLTSALLLWVVAAGSKLVVLWLIEVAFRGRVSLGGFVSVTVLVVTLLVSRAVLRRLLDSAGDAGQALV